MNCADQTVCHGAMKIGKQVAVSSATQVSEIGLISGILGLEHKSLFVSYFIYESLSSPKQKILKNHLTLPT